MYKLKGLTYSTCTVQGKLPRVGLNKMAEYSGTFWLDEAIRIT